MPRLFVKRDPENRPFRVVKQLSRDDFEYYVAALVRSDFIVQQDYNQSQATITTQTSRHDLSGIIVSINMYIAKYFDLEQKSS